MFSNNLSEAQTEALYNFLESTDGPTNIIGLFYVPEKVAFAKAAITAQCENSDAEVDYEGRVLNYLPNCLKVVWNDIGNLPAGYISNIISEFNNTNSDLYNLILKYNTLNSQKLATLTQH